MCTKSRWRYITIPMAPSGIIAPGPVAGGAAAGTLVPPIAPLLFMPMVPGKENSKIVLTDTATGVHTSLQSHKTPCELHTALYSGTQS